MGEGSTSSESWLEEGGEPRGSQMRGEGLCLVYPGVKGRRLFGYFVEYIIFHQGSSILSHSSLQLVSLPSNLCE